MSGAPNPLEADDFGAVVLHRPVFFWTLEQVEQMLGVSRGWAARNGRMSTDALTSRADRAKLRIVDLTPNQDSPTLRVRDQDLVTFLRVNRIEYS